MARRKYTVIDAPASIRRKWAREAWRTRHRKNAKRLRECVEEVQECRTECAPEMRVPDVSERKLVREAERFGADPVSFAPLREGSEMHQPVAYNPELMVVNNPGRRRRRRGLKFSLSIRHGRGIMRRKSRNHAMRVKIGGQKRGWRSYVKYWRKKGASLKSIGAKWRKACRFHGPAKAKLCPSRKRRRKARNTWKGNRRGHRRAALKGWRKRSRKGRRKSARRGKRKTKFCRTKVRKGSWKSLVRKHGVKKAAKMWKKRKRKCRVK